MRGTRGAQRLARACAAVEAPLIVVHGGGGQVSRLQSALGLETRCHEGLRVTGAEDLAAVEMSLSGSTNQALVAPSLPPVCARWDSRVATDP